ncbi:MAG: metal dependent phosphohydrolase [Humibacillus sp.]|nr:metal dependent phosphohydrolase [Humibacillus sp.]
MSETTSRGARSPATPWLTPYLVLVLLSSLVVGVWAWTQRGPLDPVALALLCGMGILSYQLREPAVSSRIGFLSFLSIILVASAVITGVFGAWLVGTLSTAIDRQQRRWTATVFNVAMNGLIGAAAAVTYQHIGGTMHVRDFQGPAELALHVGLPLIAADVVACIVNAVLLAGVVHFDRASPFGVLVRSVLIGTGPAYIGYGIIGFLFVILWFPAGLTWFSAVLVMAPLLAARWAFIQYGDEMRSHERTVDTLVTALATKEPAAAERSRRAEELARRIVEELGQGPAQIVTARYAALLHEIGHLGVPTRLLRRPRTSLSEAEQRVLDRHCVLGARMLEGIDFLEPARSGIQHQQERFDGHGTPDGLAGSAIPLSARVVAVVAAAIELGDREALGPARFTSVADRLARDEGRFDPEVLEALRDVSARSVAIGLAARGPE